VIVYRAKIVSKTSVPKAPNRSTAVPSPVVPPVRPVKTPPTFQEPVLRVVKKPVTVLRVNVVKMVSVVPISVGPTVVTKLVVRATSSVSKKAAVLDAVRYRNVPLPVIVHRGRIVATAVVSPSHLRSTAAPKPAVPLVRPAKTAKTSGVSVVVLSHNVSLPVTVLRVRTASVAPVSAFHRLSIVVPKRVALWVKLVTTPATSPAPAPELCVLRPVIVPVKENPVFEAVVLTSHLRSTAAPKPVVPLVVPVKTPKETSTSVVAKPVKRPVTVHRVRLAAMEPVLRCLLRCTAVANPAAAMVRPV
jgi:hypothetical protein